MAANGCLLTIISVIDLQTLILFRLIKLIKVIQNVFMQNVFIRLLSNFLARNN
jgi:hypothetical protein